MSEEGKWKKEKKEKETYKEKILNTVGAPETLLIENVNSSTFLN